jgi:hypothetical protein
MKRLFLASLVFELFCLVLLSSSLDMMVDRASAWLTWELLLLQSPAMTPEKLLDGV